MLRPPTDRRARLRDFADLGADWMWESDSEHFLCYISATARRAGLDARSLLGRRRVDIRIGDPKDDDWEAHLAAIEARRPFRDFTYALLDIRGRRRVVRTSGKPVHDTAGRFVGYRGIARDVTGEAEAQRQLLDSERRFRSLVGNMRGIIFCHGRAGADGHGYDGEGASLYGLDAQQIAGTVDANGKARIGTWYDAILPEHRPRYMEAERRRKELHEPYALDYQIRHPVTGDLRWMREVAWVWNDGPTGEVFFDSYIIDVTTTKRAEAELELSRERSQHLVEVAPVGMVLLTDGRCSFANPAASELVGARAEEMMGWTADELFVGVGTATLKRLLEAPPIGGKIRPMRLSLARVDGGAVPVEVSGVGFLDGESPAWQLVLVDLGERERVEILRHQASHDALTGLPNRSLVQERLQSSLAAAPGTEMAVGIIDLDGFKAINDALGHAVGDALLAAVGARLQRTLRDGDTVGRLGGDEFAIVLTGLAGRGDAPRLAERLLGALSAPFRLSGQEVRVGASLGLAFAATPADTADDVLGRADQALARAKADGRGRACFYDADLDDRSVRADIARELRHASREELWLEYQPQIDLHGGTTTAAEALLRWRSPRLGQVAPDDFVPVAETAGLMREIGTWVLEQACAQAKAWREAGLPLAVSVNVAAAQLWQADFAETVAGMLDRYAIPAAALCLELSEDVLTDPRKDGITEVLRRLAETGVRLALDGQGSAHASISDLQRIPVHELKIDRGLIGRLGSHGESESMVRAVVALAHGLGRRVVAEGVETEQQHRMLQSMDCDAAQGFIYARPQRAEALSDLAARGRLPTASAASGSVPT